MEKINFLAFDIEACNKNNDSPCKIGFTEVENGSIINNFQVLINPGEVSFEGIISGYSLTELKKNPELPVIWESLKPLFAKYPYLISHGDGYDFMILANSLLKYNIPYPAIQLLSSKNVARRVLTDLPSFQYAWVCKYLAISPGTYEAENNSKICAEILLKCMEKEGSKSIEQLCNNIKLVIGHLKPADIYEKSYLKHLWIYNPDKKKITVKDIIPDTSKFDETHILYGQHIVFTGKLTSLVRKQAQQMVADIGGIPQDGVTQETNFVIVGQQDYRVVGEDGMSGKQEKANKMKSKGLPIEVISENEFLEMFS